MNRTLLLLLVSLFLFGCNNKPNKLSVMTWNIWHGGIHGEKSENFKEDSTNTINTLQVIIQNDPDILLMQETYCCGMEIAKKAGFKYSWRGSSNLSIHSKFPILDTINVYKPFNSQGVKIKYHDKEILVFNIWLHYLPDYFKNSKLKTAEELISAEAETRVNEIKIILAEIDSIAGDKNNYPIIIGGDFNSGSHLDWIESTKGNHNGKVVEWPVSKLMWEYNFRDSFREINPNPLEYPGVTWGGFLFENMISDRIDYLYYRSSNIKVNSSEVISENKLNGFFNSDHRAVVSIFKIDL